MSWFEAAPFQVRQEVRQFPDFLSYISWPQDAVTGKYLDWYSLPIKYDRFPKFYKALNWTPSPLQPYCPLKNILASRSQEYTPVIR
jgi:hypothetical protein